MDVENKSLHSFLKAIKNTTDFVGSLMPFIVSMAKLFGNMTALVINWIGLISAIKGISSTLSDIWEYKNNKEDKVYLIINIVSAILYLLYICIIIGAAALNKNNVSFVMWMSHIALVIAPARDCYKSVNSWIRFAKC